MGKKLPKQKVQPQTDKLPKIAREPDDWFRRFPSWRISRVEFAAPWGWHELGADEVRSIQEKLSHFETMTWREILVDGNNLNHFIGVWQICKDAQRRLEELGYGDLKKIVSLRLSARERIWGVMEAGVLAVIWWDPQHTVYPIEKRYT